MFSGFGDNQYSPGWPQTYNPPASAFQGLGVQSCITMFGSDTIYLLKVQFELKGKF